jgi:nicotinate-nucleotide adenylyltransferase
MGEKVISPRFDALIDAVGDGTRGATAPSFRLGLFGGTFDPIHIGHLHIAECAREQFALDGILFIPTGQPVRKLQTGFSAAEDRHAMLKAAIAGNAHFDVSRIELERPGATYTIDTLRAIKERYGEKAELFFIVGSDSATDLVTWKEAEAIAELVTILSARRDPLLSPVGGCFPAQTTACFDVRSIDSCLIGISSRELREWVRQGRSIHYLVPNATHAYIEEQKLYQGGQEQDA